MFSAPGDYQRDLEYGDGVDKGKLQQAEKGILPANRPAPGCFVVVLAIAKRLLIRGKEACILRGA